MASKLRHRGKAIWRKNRNKRLTVERNTEKRRQWAERMFQRESSR